VGRARKKGAGKKKGVKQCALREKDAWEDSAHFQLQQGMRGQLGKSREKKKRSPIERAGGEKDQPLRGGYNHCNKHRLTVKREISSGRPQYVHRGERENGRLGWRERTYFTGGIVMERQGAWKHKSKWEIFSGPVLETHNDRNEDLRKRRRKVV